MFSRFRGRTSFANAISLMALFVALGGTSYAAVKLPKNSVGTTQIKVNGVSSSDVKNGTLRKVDFKAGELPAGQQGPQGIQGQKGEKGDPGTPGADGQDGVVGEVTVQRTDVALADNTTQAVEASCLPGQKAIGGGASVDQTGSDDIKLLVSRAGNGGFIPADGQSFNDWRAVYRNPAGGTGAAEIRAFVICVQNPA
jgi:hypothetical protein